MKTLLIMRHARAEDASFGQTDFDRELTFQGLQQATRMGATLATKNLAVEAILCSAAARTAQTAQLVAEQLHFETQNIMSEVALHNASMRVLLQYITALDEKYNTVLLVGHNPAISYLPESLTREEIGTLPTAGVVAVQIQLEEWAMVGANTAKLLWTEFPTK